MAKRIWIVNYYEGPKCNNPRYTQFAKRFTDIFFLDSCNIGILVDAKNL